MQMDTALDFSKEHPVTLDASVSASKLELNALLTIQTAKIPRAGDDIKISFDDGRVAYAAVAVLNSYNFPVIEFRGERFVLLPAGRTGDLGSGAASGTRWLVSKA
jgi:hypothetical protein